MSIRERNGRWEVVVYHGRDPLTGKERRESRTAPTERKAIALEHQMHAARDRGIRTEAKKTLGELIDQYLATMRTEESTRYQQERAFARYVRPRLGTAKLAKLRGEDLDALYTTLLRGEKGQRALSPTTVHHVHAYLRRALELAVEWGWIATNPADRAHPPAEADVEPDPPPVQVVAELLAKANEDAPALGMLLRLAMVTGMRRGELCALRRGDVEMLDNGRARIRIRRALGVGSGPAYEKPTKTKARLSLTIGGGTAGLLQMHFTEQDVLAESWGGTVEANGFVFSDQVDCSTPWHPQALSRSFRALRDSVPGAEGVQLRSARHWMATETLDAGASVKDLQARGGWARASTPLDKYAAHVRTADEVLAELLEDALLVLPTVLGE